MSILMLFVPCIVTNYVNGPTRCTFFIYLFYNFHVHSICFEWSSHSSSGVNGGVLYYTALHNRANMSSCFGFTTNSMTKAAAHIRMTVQSCVIQHTTINFWWWVTWSFKTRRVDMKIVEYIKNCILLVHLHNVIYMSILRVHWNPAVHTDQWEQFRIAHSLSLSFSKEKPFWKQWNILFRAPNLPDTSGYCLCLTGA